MKHLLSNLKLMLVALFALVSGSVWAEEVTFDASVNKSGNTTASAQEISLNGIKLAVTNGILGSDDNQYRIYKSQTLTISSTVGNITKVEFTCTASGTAKYGPGCFTADKGSYNHEDKVGTWTGDAESVTFTAESNQVRATSIVVTYTTSGNPPTPTVATPVITPATGTYFEPQTVTITAEEGAAIFYTLNEGEETAYTAPFVVSETTVVEAYAKKDEAVSSTAKVTLTFGPSCSTFAEANKMATKDRVAVRVNFTNALVTYVNGSNTYLQNETGAMLIYGTTNLTAGDIVTGYVQGQLYLYYGLPEIASPTLQVETVSTGNEVAPTEVDATAFAANPLEYINQYIVLKPSTFAEAAEFTADKVTNANFTVGENPFVLRNNFKLAFSVEAEKEYSVAGMATIYVKDDATTLQLYPTKVEDVAEYEEPVVYVPEFEYGKYVLVNVASEMFWGAGNDWGTRASLVSHPEYVKLDPRDMPNGQYKLESQVNNGDNQYYFNGDYMDNGNPVALTITKTEEPLGYLDEEETQPVYAYTIANGDNYFGWDGTSTVLGKNLAADDENALWMIVSLSNAKAELVNATAEDPTDATILIEDHNFGRNNRYANRWEGGLSKGGDDNNMNAEAYMKAFDVYQTLTDVPNGLYKLEAQAAVTFHDNRTIKEYDGNGYPVIYANDTTVNFNDMLAEDQLSSQSQMSNQFTAGLYPVEVFVEVTDGTLKIGAKSERADIWAVWDNFVLTYYGAEANADEIKTKQAYEAALETLKDGQMYHVFVEKNGVDYYLTGNGKLVGNVDEATAFTFAKVNAEGTAYETGWNLGYKFTNPSMSGSGGTGDVVNNGGIKVDSKNDRDDWERQVFFLKDGKYAVRSTNANSDNWGANTYWDALENAELPEAGYSLEPSYVWQIVALGSRDKLTEVLAEANATVEAKVNVGDHLFQKPTEAYNALSEAVTAAQAVADNAEAEEEELAAALEALQTALTTYANAYNAPEEDATYTLQQKASGLYLALDAANDAVVLSETAQQFTWVAAEGGYYLTNEEGYVGFKGTNNWTMSAQEEKKMVIIPTLVEVDGVVYYTLNESKGLIATDDTSAGSKCYTDKSVAKSGDKAYWSIRKYTENAEALAAYETAMNAATELAALCGDGLFLWPASANTDLLAAIEANTIEDPENASSEQLESAALALNAAKETTSNELKDMEVQLPEADKKYTFQLKDTEMYLDLDAENDNTIISEKKQTFSWIATEESKYYYLTDGNGLYVGHRVGTNSNDTWTTSAAEETKMPVTAVPTMVNGELYYTIECQYGGFGIDSNEAYSTVWCDKKGDKRALWTINKDDGTGIEGLTNSLSQDGLIYDLTGRRVSKALKGGIYILNGKKVVIK